MKIFLIRHGETEKNVGNKLHEKGDIETLNEKGRKQMEITGKVLKSNNIGAIFYSNEVRAEASASILSGILGCPSREVNGLEERNWGEYANKPWSEVKAVLDPMSLDERYTYEPPKGESWKTFETRLISALYEAVNTSKGSNIVIVTHGGAIRALMPHLLGVPKEESFKYDPANASITEFEYDGNSFVSVRIDDVTHLND